MNHSQETSIDGAAVFSVERGNPSAEDLAVIMAVLQAAASRAANGSTVEAKPVSSWSRNAGILRSQIAPGYGQWNAAYRRGLTR